MSKIALCRFLGVLLIGLPLYCADAPFNINLNIPFVRNVQAASNFLHKHGWPMLVTGAAAVTIFSYDKPMLRFVGNIGIGSLLMYRIMQLQKQVDILMEQQIKDNDVRIQQNGQLSASLNDVKNEQKKQADGLTETNKIVAGLPQQLIDHGKRVEEKLATFDRENINMVRTEVAAAINMLNKLKEDAVTYGDRLRIIEQDCKGLNALLVNVATKQEEIVVDYQKRFTAMEGMLTTNCNVLDDKIVASLAEIKARLKKRGVVGVVKDSENARTNFKRPAMLMASSCSGLSQTP